MRRVSDMFRMGRLFAVGVLLGVVWAPIPVQAGDDKPDLSIGAERYPDTDAIILRLEQHWIVQSDGSVRRREHKWIKLMNARPIRQEADPRIDFEEGVDHVTFHAARTHLPDGQVLDVPKYSFNRAAPGDVGGWPEYAKWQQWVVSFSGIEDGAVLEMDYEIETPQGVMPRVDADLRLNEEYPTVDRVVSVTAPKSTKVLYELERVPEKVGKFAKEASIDAETYRWEFRDLRAMPDEPQATPWRERCGRLRFTTAADGDGWIRAPLGRVTQHIRPGDTISAFVKSAVEEETDPIERVRKIANKLKDSFNYLDSPKTLRSLACRDAESVLRSNYGNPLEAGAVLVGALREAGFEAQPEIAVDATVWGKQVPTWSGFAGAVARVDLPDGPMYVHPHEGVFENPGQWGRHTLFANNPDGSLRETYIPARGEQAPSELNVTGRITVDDKGQAQGELRLNLTGLFYDPQKLRTSDAQERFAKGLVGRVISGLDVASVSIATLSTDELRATVNVTRKEPIEELRGGRMIEFGEGPAFLKDVPMPLSRSYRTTDIKLAGRFREDIDLTIQMPKGWAASILPAGFNRLESDWGAVEQSANVDDRNVRFRRLVTMQTDRLNPASFEQVQRAVNDLRAAQSRVLGFEPVPTDAAKGL